MTRRDWLVLAASQTSSLPAQRAVDSLGAARDQLVQALELMSPTASAADLLKAVGVLRRALDQDPNFGDAYYYRQLCWKKLGRNAGQQKADLEAAGDHKSEALREWRDPFRLAVPRLDDHLLAVTAKWALVVGISRFQPDVVAITRHAVNTVRGGCNACTSRVNIIMRRCLMRCFLKAAMQFMEPMQFVVWVARPAMAAFALPKEMRVSCIS